MRRFPGGQNAVVAEVRCAGNVVDECIAGESAGVVLDRQLDVSRGDWIATPGTVHGDAPLLRHAGLARHRAGGSRPQVLGAPRQPLGAGAHRQRSRAGWTSTRSRRPTHTDWR